MSTAPQLGQLIAGYWNTQAVYVAAKLGISDLLHQEPQTADQLAKAVGVQPEPLYRVLRALASVGVYQQQPDGRFAMTLLAEGLRSDVPHSQRALAILSGEEHFKAWGELLYSVQTGKTAFDHLYGEPIFEYMAKHPEQAAVFDAAMVSIRSRETPAMVDAYDFSPFGTVADIGGGNGSLLRCVLAKYPRVRGMLCDLPGVIERATPLIGAEDLAGRIQTVPTNFFEAVPPGADAYVMRHIIHNWNDPQCQTILQNVRRVISPEGRLLIIESVIPPGNDPCLSKLLDLTMLVMPGGKERTAEEFRELLASAGFELERIVPTDADVSVLEASPV